MPKNIKSWEQFKRTGDYIRAFTVGVPVPYGMERAGVSSVHAAFKKTDQAFDQKYNKRAKNYLKFCEFWNGLRGDELPDSASICHVVTGYFAENPDGEVCIVNSGKNTPARVEIRSKSGSWVEIWSA